MYKADRIKILSNNVRYLLKSRGETQVSLCSATGLTRTTTYKILEGKVLNVQQGTIKKIADFFEISHNEIETIDLRKKETTDNSISFDGNTNPAAVPIIRERNIIENLSKKIGALVISHKLTFYFGSASNLIALLLENDIPGEQVAGDLLIIKRGEGGGERQMLIYEKETKKLLITHSNCVDAEKNHIIGEIIEERFHDA